MSQQHLTAVSMPVKYPKHQLSLALGVSGFSTWRFTGKFSNEHSVLFGTLGLGLKTGIFLRTNSIPFFGSHLDDLRAECETHR